LASFAATACSALRDTFNGYAAPFILLLGLAVMALVLNLCIKKP
jgi:OFA family oxalate/formate antiporter-like MFS transporter